RSTTLRPSTCRLNPAPTSPCSTKLRSNASRTPSKPDSTIPSTATWPPFRRERFYGQVPIASKSATGCEDATVTVPPADAALLEEAVALAREAGEYTLRWFGVADLVIDRKGDGTPVTEADRGAERLVRRHLADTHPDDSIVGEEEDDVHGSSGRCWIVDPVDGTKAFTHGVPLYSTLLAMED